MSCSYFYEWLSGAFEKRAPADISKEGSSGEGISFEPIHVRRYNKLENGNDMLHWNKMTFLGCPLRTFSRDGRDKMTNEERGKAASGILYKNSKFP